MIESLFFSALCGKTNQDRVFIPSQSSEFLPIPAMSDHRSQLGSKISRTKYERCFYCEATPVVLIEYTNKKNRIDVSCNKKHRPSRKAPPDQPLCLLHFYTTDACRHVTASSISNNEQQKMIATIIDSMALQQQLPLQQELFAEAYLQIQQEIQDVIHQQQQVDCSVDGNRSDDPLAIITDLNQGGYNQSSRHLPPYDNLKSLVPRMKKVKVPNTSPEGGFLRHVPIPERIVQVQQQQIQHQKELIARMNRQSTDMNVGPTSNKSATSSKKSDSTDVTQRRKPTRSNVWNIISQEDRKNATATTTALTNHLSTVVVSDHTGQQHHDTSMVCSCGSTSVEVLSSNTNKSQDMTKAETWGNKDRHDEIINRYMCHHCGKSWNEVE